MKRLFAALFLLVLFCQSAVAQWATVTVCTTPTITASSAYSAGNIVGGPLTFANAFRDRKSGVITTVRVLDKAGQSVGYEFMPLSAALSGGTSADKGNLTLLDADLTKALPLLSVSSQKAFVDNGYAYTGDLRWVVSTDTSLRGILFTTGAPTYATTGDVTVCATIAQD